MKTIFQRDSPPKMDVALKIAESYPDINLDWLITGKGSMIKGENDSMVINKQNMKNNKGSINNLVGKSNSLNSPVNDAMDGRTHIESGNGSKLDVNNMMIDKQLILYNGTAFTPEQILEILREKDIQIAKLLAARDLCEARICEQSAEIKRLNEARLADVIKYLTKE